MGLSRLPQAEKYLSQAQWLMLKNVSCDNSVKCLVFRQLGLLYTAQGQYEKARLTLADDIYHASMKYGCLDIRVAGGYFHLGNVFFHENQLEVANSLHDQVTIMSQDSHYGQTDRQTADCLCYILVSECPIICMRYWHCGEIFLSKHLSLKLLSESQLTLSLQCLVRYLWLK
jgi:hypothetical protein